MERELKVRDCLLELAGLLIGPAGVQFGLLAGGVSGEDDEQYGNVSHIKNGAPCNDRANDSAPPLPLQRALEPVAKADGWFGAMGDAIGALERQ